ncbi:hypothetical protein OSK03_27455, partial [Escherichia coli]|nr:hypothetical protein [Escherichia coli]
QLKDENTKNRVRSYDFKRALRFSKDQIRSLTRIYENYARLLTTLLSAQLRTITQVSVVSADQIPYEVCSLGSEHDGLKCHVSRTSGWQS